MKYLYRYDYDEKYTIETYTDERKQIVVVLRKRVVIKETLAYYYSVDEYFWNLNKNDSSNFLGYSKETIKRNTFKTLKEGKTSSFQDTKEKALSNFYNRKINEIEYSKEHILKANTALKILNGTSIESIVKAKDDQSFALSDNGSSIIIDPFLIADIQRKD
jgi:hypothetical protein